MSIKLQWERYGDKWTAASHGARWYRIRMLKDGNFAAMIMGQKKKSFSGNHLGYYGFLDEAQVVCEADHNKGGAGE